LGLGRTSSHKKFKPARRGSSLPLAGYVVFYCTLAALVTYGIAWSYHTLRSHPVFALDTFEIIGASPRTDRELRLQLEQYDGQNFFSVNLAEIRDMVTAHSWVDSVDVHGHLPRRIKLLVRERIPAGLVRKGKQVIVVSPDGAAIAPIEEMAEAYANPTEADGLLDSPVLEGIPQGDNGLALIHKGLQTLNVIRETSLLFWGHIETLDLSDERNMIIHLRNVHAPLYLGDEVLPRNIRNYLTIAQYIEKEFPSLQYVELGFPNHIVIMPKEVD